MLYFRPLKRVLCLAVVLVGGAAQAGPLSVDPETFDYRALPTTGLVRVAITDASPRFEFKSGVSPFAAFRLPDEPGRYLIDVISLLNPPTDPARSRVFYPSLALLSANYLVVRASEGSSWRFDLPEYAQTISPGYRLTVEVDRSGPERFMVVYTAHDADSSTLMGAADAGQLLIKVTRQAEE
jgi:hypothetical protein